MKGNTLSTIDINAVRSLMKNDPEALVILPQAIKNLEEGTVNLVAISGKKGSGKDTFTAALAETLGKPFITHAFAYELKAQAQEMFDIIGSLKEDDYTHDMISNTLIQAYRLWDIPFITKNMDALVAGVLDDIKNGITPDSYKRSPGVWRGLQLLGTDIRRRQDDDYWVKKTVSFVLKRLAEGTSVFVSDVRFENEIKALEALGAPTVRMSVTKEVQLERLRARDGSSPSEEALNHPSEVSLDDYEFDYVIDNNGSISIKDNAEKLASKLS